MADAAPTGVRVLRVGSVLGVPIELAPSWFLLAAIVVVSYGPALARNGDPARGYLAAAAFAVLLLVSVLLHEVGHATVARLLRLRVKRITVSFLAGLTEVTDPPGTPARALAVSGAGPLVSVLLTGIGFAATRALPHGTDARAVIGLFALSNAGLALFNLLPGLPLDGGGMLRALVWKLSGSSSTGTVVAAQAGRVLAVVVVPLTVFVVVPAIGARQSLVGVVTSVLIAGFLYAGATASLRAARVERRLHGLGAAVLARPALAVPAAMPLAEALRRAHDAGLHAIVVVDEAGRPRAVVSEAAVAAVPLHRRPWIAVGDLARPLEDGLLLDPGLSGAGLVDAVRRTPASEYVVRGPQPLVLVAADLAGVASGAPQAVA